MTNNTSKLLKANLVLFAISMAVSIYLVWHHYTLINGEGGFGSFCSINATIDCDAVNASRYSELFGIPLATIALTYYVFAIILSFIGIVNAYSRRESLALLLPLSGVSFGVSIATLTIAAFVLKKWCVLCMSLQALNIATFSITVLAARRFAATTGYVREFQQANQKKMLGFLGAGLALLVAIYGLSSQLRNDSALDAEQYVNEFRAETVHKIDPGTSPRQGFQGDNPPVQLIEFADFQCPACGYAARQMHRLVRAYDDKIQLIFKNFPLDAACNPSITRTMHEHACFAAKAAWCAGRQGKFVEMYEKLYGNQLQLSRDNILDWASELGLNKFVLEACTASPEADTAIRADVDQAVKAGLSSTPTFFVNGRMVRGAIDEPRLKLLLRELGQ